MSEKRQLPAFQSEAEEAQWWFDHREERGEAMADAIRNGTARRSTIDARITSSLATIRIDPDDVPRAQELALRLGVDYQELMKQIVHEALQVKMSQMA